jgi:hypothetical protein
MKNIVLLTLLVTGMLPGYGQTSIGLIAGGNLNYQANSISKFSLEGFTSSSIVSWRAGFVSQHHLFNHFFLQPQLILSSKGSKFTEADADAGYTGEVKRRLLYAEAQANLLYKIEVGIGNFFVGAGPYIARGVDGMESTVRHYVPGPVSATYQRVDSYAPVKYRNEHPGYDPNYTRGNVVYYKPWDAGINFQLGYELKNGFFFNGFYGLGLANIEYLKNVALKNRIFGAGVGYYFKRIS